MLTKAFKNLDDVYIEWVPPQKDPIPAHDAAPVPPGRSTTQRKGEVEVKPVSAGGWTIVESLVSRGEELEKEKKFRGAVACYEQVGGINCF